MDIQSAKQTCRAEKVIATRPGIGGNAMPSLEAVCTLPVGHHGSHCDEMLHARWVS